MKEVGNAGDALETVGAEGGLRKHSQKQGILSLTVRGNKFC